MSEGSAKPTVSVVIGAYNAAAFLGRAIDSVLAQTYRDFEIIVVDDGSTDDTSKIAQAYGNKVTFISQPHRGLPAATRNTGIRNSAGALLAFLDADDSWQPEKLAAQVGVMESEPLVGLVSSNAYHWRDPARPDKLKPYLRHGQGHSGAVLGYLLKDNFIIASTAMARRDIVEDAGYFSEAEELRALEDYDLWLRLAAVSQVRYLHNALATYTDFGGSIRSERSVSQHLAGTLTILERLKQRFPDISPGDKRILERRLHEMTEQLAKVPPAGSGDDAPIVTLVDVSCPVCDSTDKAVLFRDRSRREALPLETDCVRCLDCGMVYLTPQPDRDEFAKYYEAEFHDCRHQAADDATSSGPLARLVRKMASKLLTVFDVSADAQILKGTLGGSRILDVGCGDGSKLLPYHEAGCEVWGVDINAAAVEQAKRNIPTGNFLAGAIEDLALEEGYFDVIRADNVFEHLQRPREFLVALAKLLKPGGKIVLFVPSISTWQFKVFGRYYSQVWIPFHVNLFSKRTLHSVIDRAGLTTARLYRVSDPWWTVLSFRQFFRRNSGRRVDMRHTLTSDVAMIILAPLCRLTTLFGNADMLIAVLSRP